MGNAKSHGRAAPADREEVLQGELGDAAKVVSPRGDRPIAFKPSAREAIVRILRWASEKGCALTICGSGSRRPWRWGGGQILVEMDGLARIDEIDERSLMVRAEAGVHVSELLRTLAAKGYDLGPIATPGWARTIGGCLAAAPPSRRTVALPSLPSRVVGMEFSTGGGNQVLTKAVPRSAAGPDVKTLLFGSWGSVGAILSVVLAIRPIPPARKVLSAELGSVDEALDALMTALRSGVVPSFVRLASSGSLPFLFPPDTVGGRKGARLALGLEGADGMVRAHFEVARKACSAGRMAEDPGPWSDWAGTAESVSLGGVGEKGSGADVLEGEASVATPSAARLLAVIERLSRSGGTQARACVTEASPEIAIVRFAIGESPSGGGEKTASAGAREKRSRETSAKVREAVADIEGANVDWIRAQPPRGPWQGLPPEGKLPPWACKMRRKLDPAGILNPALAD